MGRSTNSSAAIRGALPAEAEAELLEIGRAHFGPILSRPGAWAFWWPRFERIARWLVAEERAHRPGVVESLSECEGSLTLPAPGGPFTLTAKADRIDRLAAGGFLLVDYKTGSLPSKSEMQAGFAPQLPLEGAILRDGSFGGGHRRACGARILAADRRGPGRGALPDRRRTIPAR